MTKLQLKKVIKTTRNSGLCSALHPRKQMTDYQQSMFKIRGARKR